MWSTLLSAGEIAVNQKRITFLSELTWIESIRVEKKKSEVDINPMGDGK